MNESLCKKILDTLSITLSPFDNFVAKTEIEEKFTLANNRSYLMKLLTDALDFDEPWKIIPVIGETGQGKTFFCWKVKLNVDIQANVLFMDVPPNPKLFFYDLYTNIIDILGAERLREITQQITDRWGANEMKFGLFRTTNTNKVLTHAMESMRYKWSYHQDELEECMRIIIAHSMDPEKMALAERWLLGEIMDTEELFYLGIQKNLSSPYMAEELLKLIRI